MGNPIGGVPGSGVTQQLTPAAVAQGTEKAGQSNGRTFVASNPASLLATSNMSEEATALVANHKKASDFKVSKGKTESERQLELIEKIKIVEEIQGVDDFKRRFPEDSKQDYRQEDYLKGAKEQFKDPYHQYVALYELAVDFKAQPDDEVFRAIEAIEKEHPKYIEVGRQISKAAGVLAEKFEGKSYSELHEDLFARDKNTTFDFVRDHKSLGAAYADLTENSDGSDFDNRVDLMLRQLGSELNGAPAGGKVGAHEVAVIKEMMIFKRLVGIRDTCMEAQGEMRRPPNNIEHFDGHLYMKAALDIVDKPFVVPADLTALQDQMGMSESPIPVKTALTNKTAFLVRDIPEEVFANQQIKDSLVAVIQEEQDSLALAEEGGGTSDKDYGKVGERAVNLEGFIRSGDILGDLGVSVTGTNDNQQPDVVKEGEISRTEEPMADNQSGLRGVKSAASDRADKQPEMTQESTAQRATERPTQSMSGEPSNTEAKPSPESASSKPAEVTAKGSIDGLNDRGLMNRQDELLDKARGLQEQKDKDFVYGCAVTGLEYALSNDPDTLSALSAVAKDRGKGTFAKGLKIAITPEGSGKEIKLIPPDNKALQALEAQNPGKVADLVRTAIDVLQKNQDSSFDLEKINNELASLKGAISDIDSKIKKKPFKRPQGGETFERLEYPHKFRITADQGIVAPVSAEAETPGKDEVTAQKEKAKAAQQVAPVMGNQWRMPTVTGFDTPSGEDITPLIDEDGDGYTMDD